MKAKAERVGGGKKLRILWRDNNKKRTEEPGFARGARPQKPKSDASGEVLPLSTIFQAVAATPLS
jgi:hypothetical protein